MKQKVVGFVLLFVGVISILLASYGLYSLYDKSESMEHTVGFVKYLDTKRIHRYRKIRYENTAQISYDTKRYGNMYVGVKLYNPFIFQGDSISVWYSPERPEKIVIPMDDGIIYAFIVASGLLCLVLGVICVRKTINQ
mgnify:CR=1 FL=1